MKINSKYDYEKITSLFKNFETISFLDLTLNYNELIKFGYNDIVLKQILNLHLSLPFFINDDRPRINLFNEYFKKFKQS